MKNEWCNKIYPPRDALTSTGSCTRGGGGLGSTKLSSFPTKWEILMRNLALKLLTCPWHLGQRSQTFGKTNCWTSNEVTFYLKCIYVSKCLPNDSCSGSFTYDNSDELMLFCNFSTSYNIHLIGNVWRSV